jgi:lysophospholipase L1-like esterase
MSGVNLARKLAISVLSLVVVFLLAELVARAAEPGPFSLYDKRPYKRAVMTEVAAPNRRPSTVNEHIPNFEGRWDGTWYSINSRGLRGPEFEPEFTEDEFRVVALGDSCTFGKGVLEEECWPRQLERLLQQEMPDRKVMVANLGHNGYASVHYLRILEKIGVPAKPHLVVMGYNINDFPNITQAVDKRVYQGKKTLRARIPGNLRDRIGTTALGRWLRATYYDMRRARDWESMERVAKVAAGRDHENTPKFESEVEILRSMVTLVQDDLGAEMTIFLFPYESMVYLDGFNSAPVDTVRRVTGDLGVDFIDMTELFRVEAHRTDPPKGLFIRGDRYHPNAAGYAIVAESVRDAAIQNGWLAPPE